MIFASPAMITEVVLIRPTIAGQIVLAKNKARTYMIRTTQGLFQYSSRQYFPSRIGTRCDKSSNVSISTAKGENVPIMLTFIKPFMEL